MTFFVQVCLSVAACAFPAGIVLALGARWDQIDGIGNFVQVVTVVALLLAGLGWIWGW